LEVPQARNRSRSFAAIGIAEYLSHAYHLDASNRARNFFVFWRWFEMGFEDRDYNRDEVATRSGLPGFQFSSQSVILSLIVINVVVFLLDSFTAEIKYADGSTDGTHWLSRMMAIDQSKFWQVWTFLTHGFAHASLTTKVGIWHIAGNMITLWFLGRPVEQRMGRVEFLKFYPAAIVVAGFGWAIVYAIFHSGGNAFIVGASGAVSAVVVVFVFMYPKETVYLMGVLPIPAWALGVLLLVSNLFHAFDPASHIAWEAHLFGALFGLAYYKLGWKLERFQFGWLSSMFKPRSKLRVHNPDAGNEKLQEQADQILAKISAQGQDSLTSKERRIMKKYSQSLRKNRD
jgi:membrane associated rhomboid family serine protease